MTFRRIFTPLSDLCDPSHRPLTQTGSPLTLTELGRTVSDCLADQGVVNRLLPEMRRETEDLRQDYEIHEACFGYCHVDRFKADAETEVAIRLCAYRNGVQREGVLEVLAITLRDELLSERASS